MGKDFEADVRKTLKDADLALTRLGKTLTKIVFLDKQDKFTPKKAKAVSKKAIAILRQQSDVADLPRVKGFDGLPEDLKKTALRMGAAIRRLLDSEERVVRMAKLMKRNPESDYKILGKAAKEIAVEIGAAPKHIAMLVREAKGGIAPTSPTFPLLATRPMVLMLWLMVETISTATV